MGAWEDGRWEDGLRSWASLKKKSAGVFGIIGISCHNMSHVYTDIFQRCCEDTKTCPSHAHSSTGERSKLRSPRPPELHQSRFLRCRWGSLLEKHLPVIYRDLQAALHSLK